MQTSIRNGLKTMGLRLGTREPAHQMATGGNVCGGLCIDPHKSQIVSR